MSEILVIGSNGFLGRHIVEALENEGHQVERFDLSDGNDCTKRFDAKSVDTIIHLAGVIGIQDSFDNPEKFFINNTLSTALLDRDKRIILASTAAIYGDYNPYMMSKKLAEECLPENSVAFRIFNPFGTGQSESQLIPTLMRGNATIYNNGEMIRNFIHVDDVAQAFVRAVESKETGTYDLCANEALSVREVVNLMGITAVNYVMNERGESEADILDGDNSRLKKAFGWEQNIDVKESLRNWRTW